ncbi:MAG: glycosyltransferase family 39 protein [Candidatus Omnitrophica bacterium]|nr:glycosyltransferase family 39 protein [Candidatus Omnitrophota bacterium]
MMRKDLAVIFSVAVIVIFWNLGAGSLSSWDEGFYGGVARGILKTGNWLDLVWSGGRWSDKPPLYFWATALAMKTFGVNEFSVRFFSAVAAVATVLLVYLMTRKVYSERAAFASAMVLISTRQFIWAGKMGMLDATLTFFIALSIFFFILGEKKKIFLFLCPVAFGFAFMTKGVGALSAPAALFLYLLFTKKFRLLKEPLLISGIFAGLIIPVCWNAIEFRHYGKEFIRGSFVTHLFLRTTTAMDGHTGNFLTYLGVIPNKGRPWGLAGLCLIPYFLWRALNNKEEKHVPFICWAAVVILIFSAVKTKLYWYITPVYPALAVMTGVFAEQVFGKNTRMLTFTLAVISIAYLGYTKGVFNLDYSPEIKKTAMEIRTLPGAAGGMLLYGVGDPDMQFYLGDIGTNVGEKEFTDLTEKGKVLVTTRESIGNLKGLKFTELFERSGSLVVRVK